MALRAVLLVFDALVKLAAGIGVVAIGANKFALPDFHIVRFVALVVKFDLCRIPRSRPLILKCRVTSGVILDDRWLRVRQLRHDEADQLVVGLAGHVQLAVFWLRRRTRARDLDGIAGALHLRLVRMAGRARIAAGKFHQLMADMFAMTGGATRCENEGQLRVNAAQRQGFLLRLMQLQGLVAFQARTIHPFERRLDDDRLAHRGKFVGRKMALGRELQFFHAKALRAFRSARSHRLDSLHVQRGEIAFAEVRHCLIQPQSPAQIRFNVRVAL